MNEKVLTKEEFRLLSNEDKLFYIQNLHSWYDRETIFELLTSVSMEEMDSKLLGELARVHINTNKSEEGMIILDMVHEEDRDAIWNYRYAYAHTELSKELGRNFEEEARSAFEKLETAVKISNDDEVTRWCLDLVELSHLDKMLDDKKDRYPILSKKYFEYINQKNEKIDEAKEQVSLQKKKVFKKITVEDIKNIDDSWDITEPMWDAINIYDSHDNYIKSAKGFTLEQRYLLALSWYFAEVNNGGHHQFLYNSTGIVWEDTLNAFKLFGMNKYAENLEVLVDYFGGNIPFDREERWDMLESLEDKNEEEFFDILDKADDFIYEYEGEENELDYIKANPEKFVFEGEYWRY